MREKKSFRVLVVDDDRDILDLLDYNLTKEGFTVKASDNSAVAVSLAKEFNPDLVILDIMMPSPNGIEICRQLRGMKRFEDTYIFFLTARSENYFQQAALDTGGDDFIEKIIGLRSLTYKINSVLRKRFVIRKSVNVLSIGPLLISRRKTSVRIGDREIVLNRPEFELLFFFAQNPQKLITYDNLLHNIWGSEIFLFDTSIDVYIHNLSAKLGLDIIRRTGDDRYHLEIT